ncbi:MAG: VOC family protein [Actinomycetota bacterium]|nr:VOC family protein [Actinomycetota bacterium]
MPDPLEALRGLEGPVDPDPLFAAHLRARLARALSLPKGVTVSDRALEAEPEAPTATTTASPQAVIPYLIVTDARRALDWYGDAMGARRGGEPIVMPDGRIGHAELEVGGGTIYLADESPDSLVAAPRPSDGASVSLAVSVPDVDQMVERAVRAGAELERPPAGHPYGRNAVIRDPFGHRWIVSALIPLPAPGPVSGTRRPSRRRTEERSSSGPEPSSGGAETTAPAPRSGDIGYVSLWVPDAGRAADFFGRVLGWRYRPGSSDPSFQVEGGSLPHGLFGGQERSTLFLCFAVDDVSGAIVRVRSAGGAAHDPRDEPYGRTADCVDNQGVAFALVELPAWGDVGSGRRGPMNGERHGDLSYVTMEVADSEKARAFYGSVLGWRFHPGRVEDGWEAADVVPMTGMHGGHAQGTTVPMYRVDDITAAVDRLRAAGGTTTEPQRQSYGISAECVDDQGTRFYLGQL